MASHSASGLLPRSAKTLPTEPPIVHSRSICDSTLLHGMGTLTNRAGDTSPPTPTTHDDVLEAVSFALSSRLELGEVLNLLARLARRSTAASRASVLLVDRGRLVPAASVGPEPDAELFAAFRAMAPLRSSELPPLAVLLDAGVPRAIADARQDDTVRHRRLRAGAASGG
jgi:hypothetical protein